MEKQINQFISLPIAIIITGIIVAGAIIYKDAAGPETAIRRTNTVSSQTETSTSPLEEAVLPTKGVVLPLILGDLPAKLASVGAIDETAFMAIYASQGGLTPEEKKIFSENNTEPLTITSGNASFLLNIFWALGLAQKNEILERGEMMDQRYGGAANFASTGGWTIAKGNAMEHYSRHRFFNLTEEQQVLVEKVSKNIYRPCCNNSTHFPDCNHGMAMLGMLELMASQGVSESDMYKAALAVNAYWFPDTYLAIASYLQTKGLSWDKVNPKDILGKEYSSAAGFAQIAAQTIPARTSRGGSGCAVGASAPVQTAPKRQQSGCGI